MFSKAWTIWYLKPPTIFVVQKTNRGKCFLYSLLNYVPYMLTVTRMLRALSTLVLHVPLYHTYSCASRALCPTCSHASRASCLMCSHVSRALCHTCSHASRALCHTCYRGLHALCPTCSRALHALRLTCLLPYVSCVLCVLGLSVSRALCFSCLSFLQSGLRLIIVIDKNKDRANINNINLSYPLYVKNEFLHCKFLILIMKKEYPKRAHDSSFWLFFFLSL